ERLRANEAANGDARVGMAIPPPALLLAQADPALVPEAAKILAESLSRPLPPPAPGGTFRLLDDLPRTLITLEASEAALALGARGPGPRGPAPALRAALTHRDRLTRVLTAYAPGRCSPADRPAADRVLAAADREPAERDPPPLMVVLFFPSL